MRAMEYGIGGDGEYDIVDSRGCTPPRRSDRMCASLRPVPGELMLRFALWCVLLSFTMGTFAQQPEGRRPEPAQQQPSPQAAEQQGQPRPDSAARPAQTPPEPPEEKPVVTHHTITVGGKTLKYTATTGFMP